MEEGGGAPLGVGQIAKVNVRRRCIGIARPAQGTDPEA